MEEDTEALTELKWPGRASSECQCLAHACLGHSMCVATHRGSFSRTGIYILIAVGAVMMFVGFLGCYGAIQESQCLLGTVRLGGQQVLGWN